MITFTDIDGVLLNKPYIGMQLARFLLDKDLLSEKEWKAMKNSFIDYQKGQPFEPVIKSWNSGFRNAFSGKTVENMEKLIKEFEETVEVNLFPFTNKLISFLKERGPVLAVTAQLKQITHITGKHLNLDDILGLKLLSKSNGKFVPNKDVDEMNFKKHLVNRYKTNDKLLAMGDSIQDASMLKQADIAIAFRPDEKLKQEAKEKDWPIITKNDNVLKKVKNLVNAHE